MNNWELIRDIYLKMFWTLHANKCLHSWIHIRMIRGDLWRGFTCFYQGSRCCFGCQPKNIHPTPDIPEMFTFQRRQEVYGIHICMKDIHHLYIYILYINLLSSSICADTPQIDDNSSKAYHIFSQLVLIGETITSLDEAIVQEHEARQESLPMMLRE